jgi:hypothetical protein
MYTADYWNYTLMKTDWSDVDMGRWIYVGFNWLEAAIWIFLGLFVLVRQIRSRKSQWAYLYSFSFLLFGLSDIVESDSLTIGLLMFKIAVFGCIICSRKIALQDYPGAKI